MTLNVIDVSRYQAGQNIASTGAHACIVGLTFGNVGVNPYAADEIARAKAAGMMVGLYHIRAGDGPTPAQEAQHFLDAARPYLDGKTVLFLDWEECTLSDVGWAGSFCAYVQSKTGVLPVIYMSASVSLAYNWAPLRAINVALWVAQYPYNTVSGYAGVAWTPPATSWPALVGWQYCGTGGTVGGLPGMDLSVFYITAAQWLAYARPVTAQSTTVTPIEEVMPLTPADVALIWAYKNAAAGDTTDMHQTVLNAATSAHNAATQTADLTTAAGTESLRQFVADGARAAQANTAAIAALTAAVAALPAAVLNQTFTTAAGATTNVPGILDAINTKPGTTATLTADQTASIAAQIAAVLQSALPASTIQALAAQLTK